MVIAIEENIVQDKNVEFAQYYLSNDRVVL